MAWIMEKLGSVSLSVCLCLISHLLSKWKYKIKLFAYCMETCIYNELTLKSETVEDGTTAMWHGRGKLPLTSFFQVEKNGQETLLHPPKTHLIYLLKLSFHGLPYLFLSGNLICSLGGGGDRQARHSQPYLLGEGRTIYVCIMYYAQPVYVREAGTG